MTFEVERGHIMGLLGPNGAGKTTTMRIVMGVSRADRGEINWDGRPITTSTRQGFGYMPEERGLYTRMRVLDHLEYFGRLHGLEAKDATARAHTWLERLDLLPRRTSKVGELSHGNQQRLQLAAALVLEPELLVLDEPFSGLDPLAVVNLKGILLDVVHKGTAVIFSSHQLDLVEDICESVTMINRGRVVLRGSLADLKRSSGRRKVRLVSSKPLRRLPSFDGGEVLAKKDNLLEVLVDRSTDLGPLLNYAKRTPEIDELCIEPPSLSRLFIDAAEERE